MNKPHIISNITKIEPVHPGDCYQFKCDMTTRAGHVHLTGSFLYVIDFTNKYPFDEISESGKIGYVKRIMVNLFGIFEMLQIQAFNLKINDVFSIDEGKNWLVIVTEPRYISDELICLTIGFYVCPVDLVRLSA